MTTIVEDRRSAVFVKYVSVSAARYHFLNLFIKQRSSVRITIFDTNDINSDFSKHFNNHIDILAVLFVSRSIFLRNVVIDITVINFELVVNCVNVALFKLVINRVIFNIFEIFLVCIIFNIFESFLFCIIWIKYSFDLNNEIEAIFVNINISKTFRNIATINYFIIIRKNNFFNMYINEVSVTFVN